MVTTQELFRDRLTQEFVAGSALGYRRFYVDRYGRLRGIAYQEIWTPDENTAVCGVVGRMPSKNRVAEHMPSCTCGFYSYHSGRAKGYVKPRLTFDSGTGRASIEVGGIVENYGHTIVGDKGFRSQYARIVALYLPDLKHRILRRKLVSFVFPLAWLAGVVPVFAFTHRANAGDWIGSIFVAILALFASILGTAFVFPAYTLEFAETKYALIRRNYPDVPIYTDRKKMLREHAITKFEKAQPEPEPEISPQTSDDFWTMDKESI